MTCPCIVMYEIEKALSFFSAILSTVMLSMMPIHPLFKVYLVIGCVFLILHEFTKLKEYIGLRGFPLLGAFLEWISWPIGLLFIFSEWYAWKYDCYICPKCGTKIIWDSEVPKDRRVCCGIPMIHIKEYKKQ